MGLEFPKGSINGNNKSIFPGFTAKFLSLWSERDREVHMVKTDPEK